ncbi:COX15/CtaA family [Dimargaris cristalligena]|uniref:COX15/CtaA family n=1 Tax=Dimargaris cristalligena TaxID=215637 RepID=A0A4P9ZQW9_9FUNG|nr:COX15/CtaA family [Dimargaris cristalligena]|eukprot:RKP35131.1 COX15/CtaA family [Dimargaris cristalligena]
MLSLSLCPLRSTSSAAWAQSRRGFAATLRSTSTVAPPPAAEGSSQSTPPPPKASDKAVGYWLLASAASVFGIVVWGGVTRLTESGLSIVEWNLIRGMKPPTSQAEWEVEFDKYKQFPEYKRLNQHMTLDEFKFIFFMEWGHRIWGRLIGLTFILPASFFAYKGWMTPGIKKSVIGIAAMICFQGALGWYMVKSGLDHALMETPGAVPRVSQYRLSAHLGSAFVIYTAMVAAGLNVFFQNSLLDNRMGQVTRLVNSSAVNSLRHSAHGLVMLVFFTALSGAFVAGLDAGLLYDTFPLMGGRLVPPTEDLWSPEFSNEKKQVLPGKGLPTDFQPTGMWKNIFENPTTVQFNHRVLAMTTFTAVTAIYLMGRRLALPRSVRVTLNTLMSLALVQVGLGISTLLYSVPTELAAAHQAGSLSLLTAAITLMHFLKRVPK